MSPRRSAPQPRPVPDLARPRRQRLPSVAERVLPNGLRVLAVRRSSVPVVHVRLRVPGAIRGDADRARAALMGRSMMLGTAQRTQTELAESLQRIGGSLRVDDGADGLSVAGDTLRSGLGAFLDLVAEVLTTAAYPRPAVEREAGRLGDQLRRAWSQPGVVADEAWLRRRYGDHPYGRGLPSPEELLEVAPGSLRAAHRRRVVPAGALLVLVGDVVPARALDQVERALADWSGGPANGAVRRVSAAPDVPRLPLLLVDRPGAVQSNLRVGGWAPRRTDPSYAASMVANGVFGGYFSSRLTMNIREDKGYTYSPHSGIRHQRGDSRLLTSADVATEVTAPALMEILYELARIASLPPSEEEVASTVQYLTGTLALGTATQAGLAETLVEVVSDEMSVEWLREYPALLSTVTPEQVREAGRALLAPASRVTVVVGDADRIEGDLAALTAVARR